MDVQRSGSPHSFWGTAIADQVMLESCMLYRWDRYSIMFGIEIKNVVCTIPEILNPCCYDVLTQL